MVEIIFCGCQVNPKEGSGADYQNKTYGVGRRVANVVQTAKGEERRCTVCGNVHLPK